MTNQQLCFVCNNDNKINEIYYFLRDYPIDIIVLKKELTEIQGIPNEIVVHKAKQAIKFSNIPILIEDDSFSLGCLGDLPGSYIKYFMKEIGGEGLYKIAKEFNNFSATTTATLGLIRNEFDEVKIFNGIDEGEIVYPKGTTGFGFDSCFKSNDQEITYGEMLYHKKLEVSFRSKAYRELGEFLLRNNDYLTFI